MALLHKSREGTHFAVKLLFLCSFLMQKVAIVLRQALAISLFALGLGFLCSNGVNAAQPGSPGAIAKIRTYGIEVRYNPYLRRYGPYGLYWRSRYVRAHYVGEVFGLPILQIFTNRSNTHFY